MAATIVKEEPFVAKKEPFTVREEPLVIKEEPFRVKDEPLPAEEKPSEVEEASNEQSDEFDDDDDWLAAVPMHDPKMPPPNAELVEGFDYEAGRTWIYPDNMTVRGYQFHAVKISLFSNTLVVLPTGFGKTFIAAVVMYNFYRWFPSGKIIFMAPTRPLVAQQIEECKRISGIPRNDTIELTGHTSAEKRQEFWRTKRVFFVTPQIIQNDLENKLLSPKSVKCLVIDEAHRAQGNASYVEVIRILHNCNRNGFRILALTATPGSDIKRIQQVVLNLYIGEVVFRSEESLDLMNFKNSRSHDTVVVELDNRLKKYSERFAKVCNPVVGELLRAGLVYNNSIEKITRFQLLKARNQVFQHGPPTGTTKGRVILAISACLSLKYAYDLLVCYGIRPFYSHIKHIMETVGGTTGAAKAKIAPSVDCQLLIDDIKTQFCNGRAVELDSNNTEVTTLMDLSVGHPKLKKVEEILLRHFEQNKDNVQTRAIVFAKYRDSVIDISQVLSKHSPLIKAMTFVGQSKGNGKLSTSQKEQLMIVKKFREGGYNTLVATCVAEEGLDIGEIDLIICYDISASPISFVQRRGRTGRKRAGRVVILMTKDIEEGSFSRCQKQSKVIQEQMYNKSNYLPFVYKDSPRLIPKGCNPALLYLKIYSEPEPEPEIVEKKGKMRKSRKRQIEDSDDDCIETKKTKGDGRRVSRSRKSKEEPNCSFTKAKDFTPAKSEDKFHDECEESFDFDDDDDDVVGKIFEEMRRNKNKKSDTDDIVEVLE